ncbi:MAG: hypothetical protein NC120_06190 [Ruminococcus sp.]|nr:hypothetical protein [Ruminococcus sp.]
MFSKMKILAVAMAACMVFMSGCGKTSENSSGTSVSSAAEVIKINDIDWSVLSSILDGKRRITFSYTNNSKYIVYNVGFTFKIKDDLTDEEIAVLIDWGISRDTFKLYKGYGEAEQLVRQGETSKPTVFRLGILPLTSMAEYELLEPDIAEISFIGSDGLGYTVYYDFINDTYSESSEGGVAVKNWPQSELAGKIPKIDAEVILIVSDYDSICEIDILGVTKDVYDEYITRVKESGFVNNAYTDTYMVGYSSYDADGRRINIDLDTENDTMSVIISAS